MNIFPILNVPVTVIFFYVFVFIQNCASGYPLDLLALISCCFEHDDEDTGPAIQRATLYEA